MISDVPSNLVLEPKSAADVRMAFGINDNVARGMPSVAHRRTKEMQDMDHECGERMDNFKIQVLNCLCEIMYPKILGLYYRNALLD